MSKITYVLKQSDDINNVIANIDHMLFSAEVESIHISTAQNGCMLTVIPIEGYESTVAIKMNSLFAE